MRLFSSSMIGGTVALIGGEVMPVLMLPGCVPSSYTATTWNPAIMKLTVPPALMVTWFGIMADVSHNLPSPPGLAAGWY